MMSPALSSWLPRNAIALAAEQLPVREVASEWSAKWFAKGGASLIGMEPIDADHRIRGIAMELDDGVILVADDDALTAIAKLMFGNPDGVLSAADQLAIDAAAGQALVDLRQRIAQLFDLPSQAAWRPYRPDTAPAGYSYRVELDTASLAIFLADARLVDRIKSRLRPDPVHSPLGLLDVALKPQPIALSALLGTASLATGELAALSQGDVIVLDRALVDAAALAVNGVPQPAQVRVGAGDNNLELTLV